MHKAVIPVGLAGCLVIIVTASCGTLVIPQAEPHRAELRPGATGTEARAEALAQYSMAVRENIHGDSAASLTHYKDAVEAAPDDLELRLEFAFACLQAGRYEEMDDQLDALLARNPSMVRALRLKSFGLRLRGRFEEAIAPLASVIRLEPTVAAHYIETAAIHHRQGNLDAAATVIEKGLGTVTNRLEAFHALSQLYVEKAIADRKTGQTLSRTPLEILAGAAGEFSEDALLLARYGDLLTLHEKITEAVEVFAQIEALRPEDPAIRQKLAFSLLAAGDPERAITLLTDLAERHPDNFRIWGYLAEIEQEHGRTEAAIDHYRKSLTLRPERPEIHLKLTYLLLTAKRPEEALQTVINARTACPPDHRLVESQAYLLFRARDYTAAAPLFLEAEQMISKLDQRPFLNSFYATAAIALQMTGSADEAVRLLRDGMALNPELLNDYLGFVLRGHKGSELALRAQAVLETLREEIPTDSGTRLLLALFYLRNEQFALAFHHLQQTEQLALVDGGEELLNNQFYFWLGSAAERIKEYDEAETYFQQAISLQPDYADAHNYLAYMNAERGVKLDEALDHIGVALAVEPDNAAYLDTRGWIHFKLGDFATALADITLAAKSESEDPTILDHLGDVHLALGDEQKAISFWKKSYAIDPANSAVQEKLTARGLRLEDLPVNPPEQELGDKAAETEEDMDIEAIQEP